MCAICLHKTLASRLKHQRIRSRRERLIWSDHDFEHKWGRGGDPGCGGLLVRDANECSPDGTRTEGTRQGNSDDLRREGSSALARQLNEGFPSLWRPVRRIAATTAV